MGFPSNRDPVTGIESLDFSKAEKIVRKLTEREIRWQLTDAKEALDNSTEIDKAGWFAPKMGFYQDEIHVLAGELARRGL